MNEVRILEQFMKEVNKNGVGVFFPRLLGYEWRSSASVSVLALEDVGHTVKVMESIAELLLTISNLLEAVRSMHMDAKVVHGDITPENICRDDLGRLRLINFKFASTIEGDGARLVPKGCTRKFAASAVMQEAATCGYKSDICNVGATIKFWAEGLADVLQLNESEDTYHRFRQE